MSRDVVKDAKAHKVTMARLRALETMTREGKEPPPVGSREFLALLGAATYALTMGYAGSVNEHMRVAEFQAALDCDED